MTVAVQESASLPWLSPAWDRMQSARTANRLPHAMLVAGPAGVGKRVFATRLAHSLLCSDRLSDGGACGACPDCRLLSAGSHPDLIQVGPDPEAKSGEIPIAAIRSLSDREYLSPSRGAWKVVLIDPADRLNPAAANALLKTLEEPTGSTIMILIGERIGQLPATIRSRCQQVQIPIPSEAAALSWLAPQVQGSDAVLRLRLAHGSPLRALTEFDSGLIETRRERLNAFLAIAEGRRDPVAEAAEWNSLGPRRILDWLSCWVCDLLRLMVAVEPARLSNPDRQSDLAAVASGLDGAAAHRFLQRVLEARALAESNVNHLLLLESLAIDWYGITRRNPHRRN